MIKDKTFWIKYSNIKRGKQRIIILKELEIKPPFTGEELRRKINRKIEEKKIEKEEGFSLREISRQMRFFEKEGLVKCIDKSVPYGVPYQLTTLGNRIKKELINSEG